jgi:N-acetylneuraminic acid mutarotase
LQFPLGVDGQPKRRLEPAVAALGAQLVVVGGYSDGFEITDETLRYDPLVDAWDETLPPAPVKWTHAALAGVGGALYLLGGHETPDADARGEAFVLEPGATEWTALPAMPAGEERGAAGVIVAPPFVYLFGGANRTGALETNLRFDLISRTWSRVLPDLPTPRSHAAVMQREDGTFILAGGLDFANRPLGDLWRLTPGANLWRIGATMPTRRGGCAYGAFGGALVCAGGESGAAALDVVERYDPDGNLGGDFGSRELWTTLPAMPEPRAGAPGAVVSNRLYVVGGARAREFVPVDSVLVLDYIAALSPTR